MGTMINPHGPVGILWGFLIGWRLSEHAERERERGREGEREPCVSLFLIRN